MIRMDRSQARKSMPKTLTVVVPTVLIVGALLFVSFIAQGYTLLEKLAILVIALVASIAIVAWLWMKWASAIKQQQ